MPKITTKQLQADHMPSFEHLVEYMELTQALLTELIADHAIIKTLTDELKTDIGTIATFQAALTAKLDADAGITDTDYASSLTEVVAPSAAGLSTLTAADPAGTHTWDNINK